MPCKCPLFITEKDACHECMYRDGNDCLVVGRKPLSEILLKDERLDFIQEKSTPAAPTTISQKDFIRLERTILFLKEKLENHINATMKGKTSRYD